MGLLFWFGCGVMNRTKKITSMGMMVALSYIVMLVCKFFPPLFTAFPFLSYDAKDVIIVISGFIYGPLAAFFVSLGVSLIEMLTVSDTNIIGCIMNIASSCAFACVSAAIYSKIRSIKGAALSLFMGSICCVATMLVLNFLLTPVYMQIPRHTVTALLIPAILPFNLIKCTLNSAFTLILYKPFVNILRRSNLIEKNRQSGTKSSNGAVVAAGIFLVLMSIVAIYIING